ncbi:MAG TPA: heavy metal translocating P-type ATPase, partial [Nevskiaceae bacterium]
LLVVAIAVSHRVGWAWPTAAQMSLGWIEAALATIVVLWGGRGCFARCLNGARACRPRRYALAGLGAGVAWCYSVVAFLAPWALPTGFRGADGAVTAHFDWAAVIVTLAMLADLLERRARGIGDGAAEASLARVPTTTRRIQDHGEEDVPVAEVRVDDLLRILPGEQLPVDGVVVDGSTHLDTSMLTVEAEPVAKGIGDAVAAGCVNRDRPVILRVTRVPADPARPQFSTSVTQARRSGAPCTADRTTAVFVAAVMAIAILTFIGWALWGPSPSLAHALTAAIAVLVVACPAAVALPASLSMLAATTRGARAGVLFRDTAAIAALHKVDTLIIGKTGVLTSGHLQVTGVVPQPGADEREALRLAAAVETASRHPLARAIVGFAQHYGFDIPAASKLEATAGRGVGGRIDGCDVLLGNAAFLQEHDVPLESAQRDADRLRAKGMGVTYLAVDRELAALIATTDPVRPDAAITLRALERAGLEVIMATGDAHDAAVLVGNALGLADVVADATPQDKAALVRSLQTAGRRVAVAGDGVKDASALAAADVGIAMGSATDVAAPRVAVTLTSGSLDGVLRARELSLAAVRNVRQHLAFAGVYNLIGIPIAAGVLYPFCGFLLSPMLAVLAMSLASIAVVTHTLSLRHTKLSGAPVRAGARP